MDSTTSALTRLSLVYLIFSLLWSTIFHTFGLAHTPNKTHPDEVRALREIAWSMGKRDWDFRELDPCFGRGITCDCTLNNATCHVVEIDLKAQNISGGVPPEFSQLRNLRTLDLSRNYFTGSIPPQWGAMRLVHLSFMGNQLSGQLPWFLANITTLKSLNIEGNRLSGSIPQEIGMLVNLQKLILSSNFFTGSLPTSLGNLANLTDMNIEGNRLSGSIPQEIGMLVNLQKLILSSNFFTGSLPASLAHLANLTDMRLSDNSFAGKIPEYIGNWTKIEKLHIQGSPFEGPIPSTISALTRLSDLRISDLKGGESNFPPLPDMESMTTLILRKCSISGEIPGYIGDLTKLKYIDLSFNSLSGEIPTSFVQLVKVDFMYLTGNKLSGRIPGWILLRNKNHSNKNVDVSYNNFTWESSSPLECPQGSVNLVESYSAIVDSKLSKVHACLKKNFPCPAMGNQHYSLHINCGGKEVVVNDTKYEADLEPRGASMFYSGQNWAFSSTGKFMDNDIDSDVYVDTITNFSTLHNVRAADLELYTAARVSPLSLTYYGLCLMNGNYTVKLHFAEIVYANDKSFNSLGRRIFDVYIQEKLVLKDFNIEDDAGGAGKPIVKNFTAEVTSHTLKIHFYWAGRGTTGIPVRGVYGPLISAISVDPNFEPPSGQKTNALLVIGVVAGAAFLVLLFLSILWRKGLLGGKIFVDREIRGLDLQTRLFTLKEIKVATKNFDAANKIGEGGFGSVYKGVLSDGTVIAVKQLSSKSKQGNREFVNEIGMISSLQHRNLVRLFGYSAEGNQLLLVYEYMENNCVSRALFGRDASCKLKLDWPTRRKICLGIARGLAYLHEESRLKIVHRDIKTSNVLLDKDLNAKISDFGLAKLYEDDHTHISTRVAGTIGYMAPEYAMHGYLTDKADVFSFGAVALEIVSGKKNANGGPEEEYVNLLDWARVLQERGSLLELVDPGLGSEYSSEEAMAMLKVALLCISASPTLRPAMSQVVSMLESRPALEDLIQTQIPHVGEPECGHKPFRENLMLKPIKRALKMGRHVSTEHGPRGRPRGRPKGFFKHYVTKFKTYCLTPGFQPLPEI